MLLHRTPLALRYRGVLAAAGALATLGLAGSAQADGPVRKGFTFDLGAGVSFVAVQPTSNAHDHPTGGGLAFDAISLGAGFHVNPRLAFMARTSHLFIEGDRHFAFHGIGIQIYPHPRFYLGLATWLATYGAPTAFLAQASGHDDRAGFGMHLRAGTVLVSGKHNALNFFMQFYPAVFPDSNLMGGGVGLEWQSF
jgi:hypothetical protein